MHRANPQIIISKLNSSGLFACISKSVGRVKSHQRVSAMWRGIEAGIQGFCAGAGLTNEQLLALPGGRPPLVELAGRVLHGYVRADRERNLAEPVAGAGGRIPVVK
jgi:hypothetical protein